jgi:uncharacterized repeat protein (TIGR01451 family)
MSAGLTLFGVEHASAAITTAFDRTWWDNANGGIVLRGNASLTCTAAPACTNALNGTSSGAAANNNSYVMTNVDVDADGATFNSSTADLSLATGSTVLFAGLYWSADASAGASGATAPDASIKNRVRFRAPGGSYSTVTASKVSDPVPSSGAYQAYANVTSQVLAAGNGTYTVANIQAGTGNDRYAGWTLVVAYSNPAERRRNLVVYDGFGYVRNETGQKSLDITVTGFQTPQAGTVTTKIGTVVYEGDRGYTGDSLQLDNVDLSDGQNQADNAFNSTESDSGVALTARNPASPNLLGVDIDQFDASGRLANNATSAKLTLTTDTETFYPGVVTFATDLYAPLLNTGLSATDVDGGRLLPGDFIDYTFNVRNDGTDTSIKSVLTDAVPAGTTYVPGSLRVGGVAVTDAAGDDTGELQAGTGTFRLGTGANGTTGGELAPNATTTVTFRVRVDLTAPPGYTIPNSGNLTYEGKNSGGANANASASSTLTVDAPSADLEITGVVTPGTVQDDAADDPVTYALTVVNNGPEREPDATVTLTLPTGVTAGTLPAGCSLAGQTVTCHPGMIESGGTVAFSIPATVGTAAVFSSVASAHVDGIGVDPVVANDTDPVALVVNTAPTAGADTAGTTNGAFTLVDVLGNDTDPDAGDTLHTTAVSIPAHGTTTIEADGRVRYTPTMNYAGPDSFTYTVTDDHGGSRTATVTVTVANVAPTATDDNAATGEDADVTVPVLANDSDPNTGQTLAVTAVTQGGDGTVTFTPTGVTYNPDAGFAGVDTFAYTVSDGNGGTDTATVTVTVNGPPVASDDLVSTGYDVTTAPIDVRSNDSDPNAGQNLTITAVTQGGDGTVTFTPTGVTYNPNAGFSGADTFTYTVSDGNGGTDTATVTVTVANAPPTAVDRSAATGHHQAVTFNLVTGATDPNPDTLTVAGLGNPAHGVVVNNNNGTVTYTPDAGFAGTDTFTFTVGDGHGGTDDATATVTVANAAPVANADTQSVQIDHARTIGVLANDSDPNNDALTVTILAPPAHGTAAVNPDNTITYTPDAGYAGPDSFTYEITDPDGASDTATVGLTVSNSPPTANPDADVTPRATPLTLPVVSNDTDPGNDPLTIDAFTQGGRGTVTADPTNTQLTYTPDATFAGSDTFTYVVTDGNGGFSSATVTVTVLNAPPVAADDIRRVEAGAPATLTVLGNDIDPNNQPLDVHAIVQAPAHGTALINANGTISYTPQPGYFGPDSFTYTARDNAGGLSNPATVALTVDGSPVAVPDTAATDTGAAVTIIVLANDTDPEGGALTVSGNAQPGHGLLLPHADGTFTYTPDAGFSGTDTFTYTVRDASGGESGSATVTITVRNADPVAAADVAATGEGDARDIDVLGNDSDPNTGQTLTVASVTQPGHGTTAIVAGKVRYTPEAGFKGIDTFTYTAGDGNGGTATGTVTVTVSDAAPQAADDSGTTGQGVPVTVPVLDNDTDPNGDDLTVASVTQPERGTVQISASRTSVVYTPPPGFAGTVTFRYVVADPDGAQDTATVTMRVNGVEPTVVDDDPGVAVGGVTDIDVLANDGPGNPGVTLTLASVGRPGHGTAEIVDGKVRYAPAAGFKGTDTFTYTVTDGNGGTATGTVTVTVSNAAPVASADAKRTPHRTPVTVSVLGNDMDPNGDDLTVTGVTQPAHGTARIGGSKQTVTYTPPAGFSGVVTFSYTIGDGDGGTDTAEVTVTVGAPPVVPDETAEARPGKAVVIKVPTVDKDGGAVTLVGLGTPKHGTAVVNADGTVTYTPDGTFVGTDTFMYTVRGADGALASGRITVTVRAAGAAPKADDDIAGTVVGKAVVVDVLVGDTDPDGDRLTVIGATRPRHGTVLIGPDGTVTYTPEAGFAGTDTFTYTVTDGNGHTDTATVTVTVAAETVIALPLTGAGVMSVAGVGLMVLVTGAVLFSYGIRGGEKPAFAAALTGRAPGTHRHRRTHRR